MAVDSKKFLAENVLNERCTVTYRSLSRALKVHSHAAKRLLYDFHHSENSKKPNSVNATYVITGMQRPPEPATNGDANDSDGDGDDIMQSSPYISSSMPNQDAGIDSYATTSIILVREEDLEDAKSTFQSISSIQIYSLQPTILQDLNILMDVSREVLAAYAHEDPLEYGKQCGMIQNKTVKRRTGARPPPPAAATGPSTTAPSKATVPAKRPLQNDPPSQNKTEKPKSEEATDSKQPSQKENSQPPAKPTGKTAPVKKEKGNLFSSFAKTKPKQKKEEVATPAPEGAKDVNLDDASEEEPEELFPKTEKPTSTSNRESRKERENKLKMMMEDDGEEEPNGDADEEMPDIPEAEEEPEEPEEEEPAPIEQPPPPPKKPELKEEVTVQGGRRRGKRQVMKKKTVKDDEGYLVTVEEPIWESFSEDEPAPPKKKPAVSAPKGKPAAAKPGQGNIMSFFGKK